MSYIYYTTTRTRTMLKNQMGVRCVAITPIVLTSFSNKGLCNITYTQSKIKGLCLIYNRMLNYLLVRRENNIKIYWVCNYY
jgi:hypothetical protein